MQRHHAVSYAHTQGKPRWYPQQQDTVRLVLVCDISQWTPAVSGTEPTPQRSSTSPSQNHRNNPEAPGSWSQDWMELTHRT